MGFYPKYCDEVTKEDVAKAAREVIEICLALPTANDQVKFALREMNNSKSLSSKQINYLRRIASRRGITFLEQRSKYWPFEDAASCSKS
jgi:hypothetical protein